MRVCLIPKHLWLGISFTAYYEEVGVALDFTVCKDWLYAQVKVLCWTVTTTLDRTGLLFSGNYSDTE